MVDAEANLTASRLLRVLTRLRERYTDMTLLQAMLLMHIAEQPGITQREVMAHVGTADGVLSRILAVLSDIGFKNVPPLHLVDVRVDPKDRRMKRMYLTQKGQRLMEDIERDLYPGRK